MKLSLIVLASAFLSLSASASSYQDWMGSAVRVNCSAIFEHKERVIVSTTKVNMQHQGTDDESVKSVEIYSQVQLGKSEVRRKYVVNSVKVDQLGDNEEFEGHVFKPTIVSGKHPITGEKFRIEIDVDTQSDDANDMQDAKLIIGGKEQDYLKLKCNVMFAG